ncbi:MAG: CopG family transcriptional regulator [Actinomycetota bacterium]
MPDVKRLQIMIDEDLDQILERMARDEHTSKAALIRRFVRERVAPLPPIREDPIWEMVGSVDIEPVPGETIDDVVYGR